MTLGNTLIFIIAVVIALIDCSRKKVSDQDRGVFLLVFALKTFIYYVAIYFFFWINSPWWFWSTPCSKNDLNGLWEFFAYEFIDKRVGVLVCILWSLQERFYIALPTEFDVSSNGSQARARWHFIEPYPQDQECGISAEFIKNCSA